MNSDKACDLQDACFVGVDIDDGQLQRANHNVLFAHLGKSIQLLKASSMGKKLFFKITNGGSPFTRKHLTLNLYSADKNRFGFAIRKYLKCFKSC